jgi:putative transcriptional regulator
MKNKIRVLRAEKNITQGDLADAIGVSRQTINAIEKEKFDPSLPTAFRIARLFERSIEEIFQFSTDSGD